MRGPSVRENNFDLLRLLAALQVAFFHVANHLGVPIDRDHPAVAIAGNLPGVPIFFVISGFLISLSWERNPRAADYGRNRFLRIYPGLWVCLAVSVAAAMLAGDINFARTGALPWFLAQLTVGQFYNPDFLRSFGVGVLNGSLWTIPVELQFYAFVPLFYRGLGLRERRRTVGILAIAAVSVAAQYGFLALGGTSSEDLRVKLLGVSLAPYLWMFLIGVLLQRSFAALAWWLEGRAAWWLAAVAAFSLAEPWIGITVGTNSPHPLPMVLLGMAAISCAYTVPWLSGALLRGNDVSYGLYIYHAVALNAFLAQGAAGTWAALTFVLAISLAAALASWAFVERPVLRWKRGALHAVAARTP